MKKIVSLLSLVYLLTITGCIDLPNEFKAPIISYEGITIPILDKSYTLWDAIKKDTTNITKTSNNLLIFRQTKTLSTITIGDKISSEAQIQQLTSGKDNFKVDVSRVESNIGYDWTNGISPGQNVALFPAVSGTQEVILDPIDDFQYATIESGSLKLTITNSFPANSGVQLTISSIVIKNADNSGDVANYNTPIVIPAGQSILTDIPLIQNSLIKNNIKAILNIQSTQSNSSFVAPQQTGLFVIEKSTIFIKNGLVIVPSQTPIVDNDSIKLDNSDSLKVYYANFRSGKISIDIDNQLSLGAKTNIVFYDIYRSPLSTIPFDTSLYISPKTVTRVVLNFANYQLRGKNPNDVVGFIRYVVISELDSSLNKNDYKNISVDDKIIINTNTDKFIIKEAKAKVKPTSLDPIIETADFATGDANFDNLTFNKLLFSELAKIKLNFNMTTNIPVKITGKISAAEATNDIVLNDYIDESNPTISLNLANFLNSLNGKMISKLNYNISPVFNPNYSTVTVFDTNTVTPSYTVEIPLKISIDNGAYTDTTDSIDPPSEDDRKKANDIKKIRIVLDIDNGIPASVYANVKIIDKNGDLLFNVPITDTLLKSDSIYIPAAYVNDDGKVTQSYKKIVIQEISTKYIDKLFDLDKAIIDFRINTKDAASSKLVEFTTDQTIKIKAYIKMDFELNPDNL